MALRFQTSPSPLPLSDRALLFSLGLLGSATLVHAQQPLSEVGPWPSSAVILFVGIWIAMKSIIDGRFDATLPMCTSSLLHQIPGLKMVMWATEPMGTAVKFLILSHSKMPIRVPKKFTTPQRGIWEWDALTVYNGWEKKALRFKPVDKDDNEVMEDGEQKFRMGIETPDSANLDLYLTFTTKTDADKLEVAHTKLWNDLDKPTTNIFLLYWRGLLACQTAKSFEHMWSQSSKASKNTFELTEILNAVKDFKDKDLKGWKDKGARLNIFVGEPLSEPNEITLGAVMERRTLQAKHLVAMLIYIENFPKPSEVNPLLPLVWWWAKGWTKETDNMFFTLPTVKIKDRTKKPTQNTRHLEGASPTTPNTLVIAKPPAVANASAYCEITLSKGLPQIDGCEYLRTSRAPWVLSTFFGMILTFFTSLAASSNPSLATSVGLLFLKPYSNDYNFLDVAVPRLGMAADKYVGVTGRTPICVEFSTGRPAYELEIPAIASAVP